MGGSIFNLLKYKDLLAHLGIPFRVRLFNDVAIITRQKSNVSGSAQGFPGICQKTFDSPHVAQSIIPWLFVSLQSSVKRAPVNPENGSGQPLVSPCLPEDQENVRALNLLQV